MINRWNAEEAAKLGGDLLALRVYTSRLQGAEPDLVLHGGGNTSVKVTETNIFGDTEEILYVKGSGWDLATIEKEGFAPVRMTRLLQMAQQESLSDMDMVKYQRAAMIDPNAPNPSVEAILHAIIPYKFVDHTHADAVVTISNTPNGEERIQELYGANMLIVPYVMPGFVLAKKIFELTQDLDWSTVDGMILLNHGIFTFHDDPKKSYDNMVTYVSMAEQYLVDNNVAGTPDAEPQEPNLLDIARIRKSVSSACGKATLASLVDSTRAVSFSKLENVAEIAGRGPLTPDHIIRTKRVPVILGDEVREDVMKYVRDYEDYFRAYASSDQTQLTPDPKWALWPGKGAIVFGPTTKHMKIIEDITDHTMKAIYEAEQMGGWKALPPSHLFEMEYWSLEQAKLKKSGSTKAMLGQVAVVTGAASGIGKACVDLLLEEGAVVAALDINKVVESTFNSSSVLGITCDVTDGEQMNSALSRIIRHFGGLDMLVLNAGIFPKSMPISDMDPDVWARTMDINLTSQQRLISRTIPFLKEGIDPAIVIIGSKNVPAPGPGAAAYSVSKAGLNQLGRVLAMELGGYGIRVNMLHPNAVYDTAIWTDEVLQARADHYGLTVEEYKTNNVLRTEIQSRDVARLTVAMLGSIFSKTTGAQVPIDGGNDRII